MDYTYPSVYFSYFFFFLMTGLTLYFLVRSIRSGDFSRDSEEAKYRMLQDDTEGDRKWNR